MVRIALVDDVPAIQLIAKLSLVDAYEDILSAEVQEKFLAEYYSQEIINERIQNMNILMGETDAGTVGFVIYAMEEDLIRIFALYVLPAHQRQGVGKELLKTLMNLANDSSRGVGIELESRNVRAQKFYLKEGFEVEKTYPLDLFGQPLKMMYFVHRFK